jgi:hypothetical protein
LEEASDFASFVKAENEVPGLLIPRQLTSVDLCLFCVMAAVEPSPPRSCRRNTPNELTAIANSFGAPEILT